MELSAGRPEWHWPGRSDLAGDYEGPEAVRELLSALATRIGPIDLRPQDTLISANHVMVICDPYVERGGRRTYSLAGGFLFDVREDKVLKVFSFTLDLYALDELLSREPDRGGAALER
jgi:hypothetical protein